MIKYFKMKKKEIELKLMLYTYIQNFLKGKEEIINVISSFTTALAGSSQDELKDAFLSKLAELAHEQAAKERENK